MSILVILVGNIGTGKTTFCNSLKNKDRFIVRPDEMKGSHKDIFNQMDGEIKNGLENFKWVIIDSPNMSKKLRAVKRYYARGKHQIIVFDFGPGDEISLQRRVRNNPEYSSDEWRKIHTKYQSEYEKPDKEEGFEHVFRMQDAAFVAGNNKEKIQAK